MFKRYINVANDFSRSPFGRIYSDGPNSATRFREEFLIPAFTDCETTVHIDFNEVLGLSASFIKEAFGGLIRDSIISHAELKKRLRITISDVDSYAFACVIMLHIDNAESDRQQLSNETKAPVADPAETKWIISSNVPVAISIAELELHKSEHIIFFDTRIGAELEAESRIKRAIAVTTEAYNKLIILMHTKPWELK